MKHRNVAIAVLLLAMLLLDGCGGASQPSGPPSLAYASATAGAGTPGSANAGKTLQILRPQGPVNALAWSPDSTRIALASTGNNGGATFQVWNASTGKLISTFDEQLASACCIAWSPDGTRILLGGQPYADMDPNNLYIWDAATGKPLVEFASDTAEEHLYIQAAAWAPDSRRIAVAVLTNPPFTATNPNPPLREVAQIWDTKTGMLLSTDQVAFPTSGQPINEIAWSPDGKEIALGDGLKTVQIWDAATGKRLLTYRGHTVLPLAIAWSPTGKAIASASGEPEVQVWDPATGTMFFRYHGHVGNVDALAWSPDGMRIVSGSQGAGGSVEDRPIQVWDAFTGQHPFYYMAQSESITALAWSPDGMEIASAGEATVQIWQAPPES